MTRDGRPVLALLESVLCLDCSGVYAKPVRGGTRSANPGCPYCGYVGWLPLTPPDARPAAPRRLGAGRLPHRSAPGG